MLRAVLVYPVLALYVFVGAVLFVPLTWVIRDIRPIYWVARTGVKLGLLLSGLHVETVHLERAFEHPTNIFLCNHVSNIDPPALFAVLPRIAVILKKELASIPLLGYVMKLGSFIYVDRSKPDSRRHALEQGVETLRRGINLLIFPEGTRSRTGEMLPFRPGPFTMAIEAGVPLAPITIHGSRELMPKGTLKIRPGRVKLVFHPPVETKGMTMAERGELMEAVRATMAAELERRG